MKSLGDCSWLNEYIGIPYVFGGRDRLGLDCYGLVKLIYQDQYGETLPDWQTDIQKLSIRDAEFEKAINGSDWDEHEEPCDGDFVVCRSKRLAHHMGVYLGVVSCIVVMVPVLFMSRCHGLEISTIRFNLASGIHVAD